MKRFAKAALALLLALALTVPAWAAELWPGEEDIYLQLSDAAQQTFDQLNTKENLARFRSGESIRLGFEGSYSSPAELSQKIETCIQIAMDAYAAILQIHPEFFWLSGCNIGGSYSYGGGSFEYPMLLTPKLHAPWSSGARSVSDDEATLREIVEEVAGEASVQGGPYQQLLYVHDWLTEHNIYNTEAASYGANSYYDYLPWTPLGALTDESMPVCEGYARAFSMICSELGYPNLYVTGIAVSDDGSQGPHAWNMVQVANQWYAVDVTFDDPTVNGVNSVVSGHESHTYFMVGEETLLDDYYVFSDSHFPTGQHAGGISFTYPALADEALDPDFTWGPGDVDEPEYIHFRDVDDTAYYAPAVQWAVGIGVTKGTTWDVENGIFEFSPNDTVTRAQAVTFLWRAMWEPEPETQINRFSDVAAGSYYEKAVLWAVENGITNGTNWDEENGIYEFSPNDPVTRGQMLTFLCRTVNGADSTAGSPWYAAAERWADDFGILGDTAIRYATGGSCPRSDVVYYLYHAILTMAG